jgi:taurine dioxygenase
MASVEIKLDIAPIEAGFGVAIRGIDLARHAVDADVVRALVDRLHEHRVIVIKDQTLTYAQFSAFGKHWGEAIIHPLAASRPDLVAPGFPEIIPIQNTGKAAADEKHRMSAVFWHTDHIEARPAIKTMLYCRKAPRQGGHTQYADTLGAYNALPENTKQRIDDLVAFHEYGAGAREAGEYDARAILSEEDKKRYQRTRLPLVLRHPYTGKKALFAVAGTACGIEGMEQQDADKLLRELKLHCLQPQFRYDHKYVPGDLIVWDTLATLHSASPLAYAEKEEDIRLLWRISCRGPVLTPESLSHSEAQKLSA